MGPFSNLDQLEVTAWVLWWGDSTLGEVWLISDGWQGVGCGAQAISRAKVARLGIECLMLIESLLALYSSRETGTMIEISLPSIWFFPWVLL